jgi:hypothetical protein
MDRFATLPLRNLLGCSLLGCSLVCLAGCGSSSPTTAEQSGQQSARPVAQNAPSSPPSDVVSQFLDEIRRGGQDSHAHQLLTKRAQEELKRIGRTVEPIGSPDARFTVTRFEMLPDEENSALVHSIWIEPSDDGTTQDFQVVWAVEQEAGNWRISGLAMEVDQTQPPLIIDFENGEMMARLLAAPELQSASSNPPGQPAAAAAPVDTPSQASAADPTPSR